MLLWMREFLNQFNGNPFSDAREGWLCFEHGWFRWPNRFRFRGFP